jgi:lipid-binding SYLF domain-containing protein
MSHKIWIGFVIAVSLAIASHGVSASGKGGDVAKAQSALTSLYQKVPSTKALGAKARGILVFPEITKAGFVVGGQHGDGVLFQGGRAVAFYRTSGASFGLQAGAQTFGYAMFLMTDKAVKQLDAANGWEIGTGPTVVMIDEGKAANLTTTTAKDDIYAFVFGQKGLMGGISLEGSKITKSSDKSTH